MVYFKRAEFWRRTGAGRKAVLRNQIAIHQTLPNQTNSHNDHLSQSILLFCQAILYNTPRKTTPKPMPEGS